LDVVVERLGNITEVEAVLAKQRRIKSIGHLRRTQDKNFDAIKLALQMLPFRAVAVWDSPQLVLCVAQNQNDGERENESPDKEFPNPSVAHVVDVQNWK
jgi:hypothetical protein